MTAPHPGNVVWRITNPPSGKKPSAVHCIVVRMTAGGFVTVRSSTFSRNEFSVRAEDIFSDRDSCRAEIVRRAEQSTEAQRDPTHI